MNANEMIKKSIILIFLGLMAGACAPVVDNNTIETLAAQTVAAQQYTEATNAGEVGQQLDENSPTEVTVEPEPVAVNEKDVQQHDLALPEDLSVITAENAENLVELVAIYPYFPPYYQISADGRMGAAADLEGIDIVDMGTGEMLTHIPAELPNSKFGIDRYIQFNRDGSFIALTTREAIQVWQVNGGLIYTAPYSRQINTDANIFGAEIPQLALSPDGTLLAISGVDFSSDSSKRYFKVVNVQENRIVFAWNGTDESPHGSLYDFDGLGFSADGSLLQTFDAIRYYADSGTAYEAFRFWSVDSWEEVERTSKEVLAGFDRSELLFPLQTDESVDLVERSSGQIANHLTGTGCSWAYPCDVKLSPDGGYAAFLDYTLEPLQFQRDLLATEMAIWDVAGETALENVALTTRNLDGISLQKDGAYQAVPGQVGALPGENSWWTTDTKFVGLDARDGQIRFSPQRLSTAEDDCYFCGSCEIDLNTGQTHCARGFYSAEGNPFSFIVEGSVVILDFGGEGATAERSQIELPAMLGGDTSVRMLGYSEAYQRAFYCLDEATRQQTCQIYDLANQDILDERQDIDAVQFSADGKYAAFIDREEKGLFLADFEKGTVKKVEAYQSRAWPVSPSFGKEGSQLVYMVQNVSAQDVLSLEWVEAEGANVLRRFNLDISQIIEPTLLDWGGENELVALANDAGAVYIVGQERGKLVYSWQAEDEKIIGLAFAMKNKVLLTMNQDGVVKVWGVEGT